MIKKELINQSIDYIMQHFDEDISVGDVADHFHFSKFYFCRTFKEVTGESIYAFMKRLKMDQSAIDLKLEKDKPIIDIGLDYGYSSSNYSSAFKKHHHISPTEFRKSANETSMFDPFRPEELVRFKSFEEQASRIKILKMDDIVVIYERMIGNYMELEKRWGLFMNTYNDCMKADTLLIEKFYDDPSITSLNQCICDLCMTVDKTSQLDNKTTIEGGKFAVYRFEGAIQDIFFTIQGVFRVWLPQSGYEMDRRYGLNIYREMDRTNGSVVLDLCIPIK